MIFPTLDIEKTFWSKGFNLVCGIDEVGRGAFAGPVVAGAVIFPQDVVLPFGLADSKMISAAKREKLDKEIKNKALSWAIAEVSVKEINRLGIGKATQRAFRKSLKILSPKAEFVLIDAFFIKHFAHNMQLAVKEGDSICASISAASIIAKVYRDDLMNKLDKRYPAYNFIKNKGYGTVAHRKALNLFGLTPFHRRSFNLEKFISIKFS